MTDRTARRLRATLLMSVAGIGLSLAGSPALANDGDAPVTGLLDVNQAERVAQVAASALIDAGQAGRASQRPLIDYAPEVDAQIVIGAPGTPTTARDPVNVNGVGQMFVDQGDGFIGLCTGTLINPRTVIFAAHCVNSRAASDYGQNSGGTPISFGFSNNNLNGVRSWYLPGAGQYQTNTGLYIYDANAVAYHPLSLEPDANDFLYGDVALASLDTPAEGIPTWALLFSPLPQTPGGANGTGYHVNITGYGNNGTGSTGSTGGIDYRRRVAENMLGALASVDDFEGFFFGGSAGLPQNLYWIDFDDPRRGTPAADPRDFNAWRDNPQPNEGITASGDSGGPLILDRTFARQVVIGVLSGGYTRFFTGAPPNGYGTASFYQPLYLYWDWIAANNPYRYVTNVAGNRNWTDGANWVTLVDPNYQIIGPNGQIVTGVPTQTGEANTGTGGKFGEMCFEGPINAGFSDCYNLATDTYTFAQRPIGTDGGGTAGNSAAVVSTDGLTSGAASGFIDSATPEMQAAAQALPAPTIANGLPGATGFTPNNSDGDRSQGVLPRYFDVTLAAAGTTTLSSAVTVDKFTLAGAQAALTITSAGSLTSLMDVTQVIGTMHVDGVLRAPSDFFIMTGGLSGNGQIHAPFTTSMAGVIAPGTATTVGTLTFNGNLILASGTSYIVNLANGMSDLVAVKRVNGIHGEANVGGALSLQFTNAIRGNQSYTILTAEGGVSGAFAAPAAISAILRPMLRYTATSVLLDITAAAYTSVVTTANPVAYAYAQLLDANRGRASSYDGLYGPLDLQSASTIVSTLNSLAPASESTAQTLGMASVDANAGFLRTRLSTLNPGDLGGTLARYGQPVQVAALGFSPYAASAVRSDAAPTMVQEGALPEHMSGFIAGGYVDGHGSGMSGIGGKDHFDGWFLGGGVEVGLGDNSLIGFSLSYSQLDGTAAFPGQSVKNESVQGSVYAKTGTQGGLVLDGRVSAGAIGISSTRAISFLGTPYTLRAKDNALVVDGELGIGMDVGGDVLEIAPRIAARATHIGFGSAVESGGPMALDLRRPEYNSVQGRAGLTIGAKSAKVRPFVTGTYVHEFEDQPGFVSANLVGGAGGGVLFALNGQDKDWAEVTGGLTVKAGSVDLSVAVDTTLERSDLSAQTYRGSVTFRF